MKFHDRYLVNGLIFLVNGLNENGVKTHLQKKC